MIIHVWNEEDMVRFFHGIAFFQVTKNLLRKIDMEFSKSLQRTYWQRSFESKKLYEELLINSYLFNQFENAIRNG